MKYALISGASSGLAKEVINLIKDDYYIFALDINPKLSLELEQYSNVATFKVDVTNMSDIQLAKAEILKKTDRLDLLINFAGIVILGSTVEIEPDKALRLMDINLFGMYRMNQTFFDLLLKAKGRIINVSSEYGVLDAIPFHSFYTMSKHAVEIYNDSLRREVSSLGVKVIKIRPGAFKTKMQNNIQNQFNELTKETKYFEKPLFRMKFLMDKELVKAKDTSKIIKTFRKAIYAKHPKDVYNVNNSFKMKLLSCLPSKLQDKIYKHFFSNKE